MKQKRDRERDITKRMLTTHSTLTSRILSIIPNIILIIALIGFYFYSLTNPILTDYENWIYWTVKVLIAYNIIAASARTIIAPFLSLIAACACFWASLHYQMAILSFSDLVQLSIVTILGLIINLLVD